MDDTKSYYKFMIKIPKTKEKLYKFILYRGVLEEVKNYHFVLTTVSQRFLAAIRSNYFLVADWSERQEFRLCLVISTVR